MAEEELINWDEALEQVGGDRDFLKEVLTDLEEECKAAVTEIGNGINTSNFEEIRKAAHRIKGSSSYLCCHRLREISLKLQEAGHAGESNPPNAPKLLQTIKEMFEDFKTAFADTSNEIIRFFA